MAGAEKAGRQGGATIINVFTVPAGHQAEELVALLRDITEQVMRHQPGFRQATIHVSLDRTRVANYAEWESAEAFGQVMRSGVARSHMAEIDRLFPHDANIYQVVSVSNADGELLQDP